jgi:Mn-dependent DtxR family transcriptional regulator
MDANEKVIQTLKSAGKPMKNGEIAEAAGVEKKEVEKAIKKLVAEGKLHSPQRCFYDIKSKKTG